MRILVKTTGLSHDEWLTYRKRGICGSDASIVLGLNPYRSIFELWEDKTGTAEKKETDNDFTHFGNVMEPIIIKEFQNRTGLKVRRKNAMLQSEEFPWMLANFDGVIKEEDGTFSIFEAKTATEYKRDVWEQGVPAEYMAQLQHYMAVTGYKKAYIAAVVGGNSWFCHVVERDGAYIDNLVKKESEFWKCVRRKTLPQADSSKATTEYLNRKYQRTIKDAVQLPDEAYGLIQEYLSSMKLTKELEKEQAELSNRLKVMLADNEVGYAGDRKVTWSSAVRQTADIDKIKAAFGDKYGEYVRETAYRRFSVA